MDFVSILSIVDPVSISIILIGLGMYGGFEIWGDCDEDCVEEVF